MTTLTMAPTLGDLLKFELNGNYSREIVTLKSGTNYALGSVLGKITASGKYRLSPNAEATGDEGAETAVAVRRRRAWFRPPSRAFADRPSFGEFAIAG